MWWRLPKVNNIIDRLIEFRDARNWQKYHTPEALARAIGIEAGELNELFLWGREPSKNEAAAEIADVMIFCLNLCDVMGIDPEQAIHEKIDKNEAKYGRL
jgi:NTP pyrophosphatase (non-canonical NTP hydrolase)